MHLSWKRLQWLRAKRYLRENKGPVGALLAGGAALCLFWAARGSTACMDWFIRYAAAPWKRFWGAAADPLPFSLCEALCTALGLWLIFMAVRTVQKQLEGRRVLGRRLISLAALAVWGYAGVCAFWGVHYYGTGFSQKSGLEPAPVSVEALAATTRWFAQGASRTAARVQRGADGCFEGDKAAILAYGSRSYEQLVTEWPFLQGPDRAPKPAVYSWFMSAAGFTGYLFPYLGESTLNVHCPGVYLPVTVAHEMAHQRGVAPEQEANFLGIAACLTSPDPVYQYSGWLFGYSHLSSALYSADQKAWQEIWDELDEGCQADIRQNNAYWDSFRSPVTTLVQSGYENFLQGYGQILGLASYGACVDLLVARYGAAAQAGQPPL